jgi:outer membrane receptor protein involved in Fe transport
MDFLTGRTAPPCPRKSTRDIQLPDGAVVSRGMFVLALVMLAGATANAGAQSSVAGVVRDETGFALPGVSVELWRGKDVVRSTTTGPDGGYRIEGLEAGAFQATFSLVNFATARRNVDVAPGAAQSVNVVMHLSLNADVIVTGRRTFVNLADVENPAENLVGIALASSQGAITAQQLDARPMMRTGEVLETVPGVVISQHSGEGKANQYYLRGFNLDHGTDFSTTVAGMPVNLPTHAHGQGYSDLNFLIPELISGVQFAKGPYFAEQGDFATAGSANINYAANLGRPIVRVTAGGEGFARALVAASPRLGGGHLLAALEAEHNDGPWDRPDAYRKVNGVVRYTRGDALNGFSFTGMGYRASWNATDQIPERAIRDGIVGRFGAIDPTDGGDTYRYSGSAEWQRTRGNGTTKVTAYAIGSDLNLFSNFTYFLDDREHGDQFHQADHRYVTGVRASHRRIGRWGAREAQNTVGVQLRNDDITNVALSHTQARRLLDTVRQDAVIETSAAVYGQNEIVWTPWLRTLAGVRMDGYRFDVHADRPANGGTRHAGRMGPKGGVVLGPFRGSEIYANGGVGFHSNDARGVTITGDPVTGDPVAPVTPLVRALGAETGLRTVAVSHWQSSVTMWTLSLDSELVFLGDAGTVEPSRPSRRFGVEWANYFSPRPWFVIDGDLSWSRARFTDVDPSGDRIPGSVALVGSGGLTIDAVRNVFASVRLRYFGPRPLVEDGSTRSKATALVNLDAGYRFSTRARLGVDVFNLLDAVDSDVDYYYRSRLPGEPPAGVNDIHLHPTLPRTARLVLQVAF